ncbi:MAG TPA: hypothetical protein VFR84_04070 [Candidatus Angelobacter sp.]|nr:hypothetical protein [Candidatus Angelobacter sp.]
MSKEEIVAAILQCTEELRHAPLAGELITRTKVSLYAIRRTFGNYQRALKACGLERDGSGYKLALEELFPDWAGVVRKLGRVPTITDYRLHGRHSYRPLVRHFGSWLTVPAGMLDYGREQKLEDAWKDVLELAAQHLLESPEGGQGRWRRALRRPPASPSVQAPLIDNDEPFYGELMNDAPMIYAPINEAGVAVLFGAVARDLGFRIARVQNGFPHREAMRVVAPGRLQRKLIEFEYESRNFRLHQHKAARCNMIVCWRHNWPECPLEVLELSEAVKG